jgi:hypothetical protein
LFAAATKITICNGEKATFWTDRWLFDQIPADIAPDIFKISIWKNMTLKEALSNEKWLFDQRHHLDVHHLPQLLKLAELVERVQLTNEPDDIVWRFGNKTFYTARSAYMLQFWGATRTDYSKIIWKGWAPARCKFFIWTLMLNRVLTADKLLPRQWDNEYFYPLSRSKKTSIQQAVCLRNAHSVIGFGQQWRITSAWRISILLVGSARIYPSKDGTRRWLEISPKHKES